jgi:hypothetical protein
VKTQRKYGNATYIVEEVVSTTELLQRLENHAQSNAIEHAGSSDELMPLLIVRLGFKLFANLVHLFHDADVVLGNTVKLSEGSLGAFHLSMTEFKAGAFREEDHTTAQDQSEEEGETKGNAPLSSAIHGVGTQVDTVGEEDTQGNEQLVATDHRTTDVTGGTFTLVHRHEQGAASDTKTSDPTADDHLVPVAIRGGNLHNQSNVEDHTPKRDRPFAAELVGHGSTDEGTDHSTDRQQTDNQTGPGGTERVFAVGTKLTISLQVVAHLLEAGDLTSVISEQKTTHGDKEGHHQGTRGDPRDWGIDPHRAHRLLHGAILEGGIEGWLVSRGNGLPMVGGRFDTHCVYIKGVWLKEPQVGLYMELETKAGRYMTR